MKNSFICYVDMDGVMNRFEDDKNARLNMWQPKYFRNIPVRKGISELLVRINKESYVVILTKVINRIGVTKEKSEWLQEYISPDAYSDVVYVPYDRSKSDYMYSYYPSMLIDDNESNIEECEKKGCRGIFLSDLKISQKYPNARELNDIWNFYKNLISNL